MSIREEKLLSFERASFLLRYDPKTGIIRWINSPRGTKKGAVAGRISTGYVRIRVDYNEFFAHRLAWLLMTKSWPKRFIDHKNHNRSDNRWKNLQEATSSQNNHKSPKVTSKTGFRGVYKCAHGTRFYSQISVNRKKIHLGIFKTAEAANRAYQKAAKYYFKEFAME